MITGQNESVRFYPGPTETERTRSERFLKSDSDEDWHLFCQMLMCLNEFAYID